MESRVAAWLGGRGLEVVAANVSIGGGEIDLIARTQVGDEPLYVFVEVRSRHDARLGHPLETVNRAKQAHIIRAATAFLVREGLWERVATRFDVVAVVGAPGPEEQIEWIQGAFEAG